MAICRAIAVRASRLREFVRSTGVSLNAEATLSLMVLSVTASAAAV